MNRKVLGIFLLAILVAISISNAQVIDDNKYATVKAWIRIMGENGWGEWQELEDPPLEGFSLKIRQPIQIKIEVTPKQDSLIHIIASESGTVFNFDILSVTPFGDFKYGIYGVDRKNEDVRWENVSMGKPVGAIWTISPNSNWTGGTAGFNINYQVNKAPPNTGMVLKNNFFVIIYPYIENEQWTGPTYDNGNGGGGGGGRDGGIPGFEGIFVLAALSFIVMQKRKKK